MFAAPAFGARQVTIPKFSPEGFCELVQREHVTHTVLVPTMLNLLTQIPEAKPYDLSSLEVLAYGGVANTPRRFPSRGKNLLKTETIPPHFSLTDSLFLSA